MELPEMQIWIGITQSEFRDQRRQESVTATDGSVNVRQTAPNGTPIAQMFPNKEVVVLDQQLVNGAVWYQIQKTDGTVGWVYGEFLKVQ